MRSLPPKWPFILLVLFPLLYKLVLLKFSVLSLAGDEAHYWLWSKSLDLSYFSKGPIIALLIRAGTEIFGDTEFGVRVGVLFCSTAFSAFFCYWAYISSLRDPISKSYFQASALLLTSPFFFALGLGATTDAPAFLFWLLSLFFATAALQGSSKLWLMCWSCIGIAVLAKYSALAAPVCLCAYLLVYQKQHLYNRWFLVGFGVFIIALVPPLLWNSQHQWVNFAHNAGHLGLKSDSGFRWWGPVEVIATFIGMLGVFTGLLLLRGFYLRSPASHKQFLLWMSVPLALVCLLVSFTRPVYANWPMPLAFLLALLLFGSGTISKKWFTVAIATNIFGILIATMLALGFSFGLSPVKLPTKKLVGWPEVGEQVALLAQNLDFIVSVRYDVGSLLSFYSKNRLPVVCPVVEDRRRNQFDIWRHELRMSGKSALIVLQEESLPLEIQKSFNEITEVGTPYEVIFNGKLIRKFYFFKGLGFKGPQWSAATHS